MKKLSALILVLAVLFALTNNTFSQPRLVITLKGGYSQPLGALAGDPADYFTQTPLTTTSRDHKLFDKIGFNFGADVKYAFDKKRSVRGVLGLGYAMFSNSYEIPANTSGGYGTGTKFKPQFNFFAASLGIEYAIQPKKKIVPFIGAGFAGFFYSGKAFSYDPALTSFPEIKWKSGSRFGIYANLGADFKVAKQIAINVGVKFNYINLIGKKEYDSTLVTTSEIELFDKEYTRGGVTYKAAELMSIDFSAGISFFLMQPKAKMKK